MTVVSELQEALRDFNEAANSKLEEAFSLSGEEQKAAFIEAERLSLRSNLTSRLLLEAHEEKFVNIVRELELAVGEEKLRQSDIFGRLEELLASIKETLGSRQVPKQDPPQIIHGFLTDSESSEELGVKANVVEEGQGQPDSIDKDENGQDTTYGLSLTFPLPPLSADGRMIMTEAHLLGLWRRSCFPVYEGGIILFGIRGALPMYVEGTDFTAQHEIRPADLNYTTMRCTLGQWKPGEGLALFPGSTVPYGPSVEKRIASNGRGINQIGRGRYKNYRAGWHKRREGSAGHWALLQECPITLQRTGDDADYDLHDRWESGRRAGDNIHCAFGMGSGDNIPGSKYSSFGCSVVAGSVIKGSEGSESGPWRKFIASFDKKNGQSETEYVVFSAAEVIEMINSHCVGKSVVLRFGSKGPLVEELQAKLSDKLARPIRTDGDFGPVTFEAVLEFQELVFGPTADDGIVGSQTAEKLGFVLPTFDFLEAISGNSISDPISQSDTRASSNEALISNGSSSSHSLSVPTIDHGLGQLVGEDKFRKLARIPSSGWRRDNYVSYMKALTSERAEEILERFGLTKSALRLACFFGQALHETGRFTLKRESLNYTSVDQIRKTWKKRTQNMTDASIRSNLVRNEIAIGDFAYGGRMGNGLNNGDGYKYRGGGVFQTTGRDAYRRYSDLAGVDLESNPDFIEDPIISLLTACGEWKSFGGNNLADARAVKKISRALNQGNANSNYAAIGEVERIELTNRAIEVLS